MYKAEKKLRLYLKGRRMMMMMMMVNAVSKVMLLEVRALVLTAAINWKRRQQLV
jgi:hypothetical protein